MALKESRELLNSPVVANCRMNRERELCGGNSYTRDLGFDPVAWLTSRLEATDSVRWLDLCCGRGRALIEAGRKFADSGSEIEITGVDLVGMFDAPDSGNVNLVESSLENWEPDQKFELITCVHGLHYVGDKLGVIARAVSWLTDTGLFAAHLDPKNLRHSGYRDFGRVVTKALRESGLEFNAPRRIVRSDGHSQLNWPWQYVGADDEAGPNFTGQPAVNSWYSDRTSEPLDTEANS